MEGWEFEKLKEEAKKYAAFFNIKSENFIPESSYKKAAFSDCLPIYKLKNVFQIYPCKIIRIAGTGNKCIR